MNGSLARLCGTKSWDRYSVNFVTWDVYLPWGLPNIHSLLLSSPLLSLYICVSPLVAQSISNISITRFAPSWLPPTNLNCPGGEKWIFPPQWPPSASLSSPNHHLQVLLWLCWNIVRSQSDHMYKFWAALKVPHRPAQRTQLLHYLTIL